MKRKREKIRAIWSNENPAKLRKFINFVDHWEDSFQMDSEEFYTKIAQQELNKEPTVSLSQHPMQNGHVASASSTKRHKIETASEIEYVNNHHPFGYSPEVVAEPIPRQEMVRWPQLPNQFTFSYQSSYSMINESVARKEGYRAQEVVRSGTESLPYQYFLPKQAHLPSLEDISDPGVHGVAYLPPQYFLPEQTPLPSLEDIGDSDTQEASSGIAYLLPQYFLSELASLPSLEDIGDSDIEEKKGNEEEELAEVLLSLNDKNNTDSEVTQEIIAPRQYSIFSSLEKEKQSIRDIPEPMSEEHKEKVKIMEKLGIDNMAPQDYIPSSLDKNDLVYVSPVDVLKGFHGRGLFAKKDIPAGTCIGAYTGRVFNSQKEYAKYLKENPEQNNSYAMTLGKKIVDASIMGNQTRYANYSDTQDNASYQPRMIRRKRVAAIVTTKLIPKGQPVLVDYNLSSPPNYRFLNPEDKSCSAQEKFRKKSKDYELLPVEQKIESLSIEAGEYLYASSVGKLVFKNKSLPKKLKSAADRLFLRTNSQQEILDFDKADTFTPLMFACYLGHFGNVQTLVKHQTNVNRQQHDSGKCPLFFALEGYAANTNTNKRKNYLQIMTHLINNKANIFAHDRKQMTFIHKAISTLSTKDFKTLVRFLNKNYKKDFTSSFHYINEDNFDIVLYCLSIKSLDKAEILLELHPQSFKENCIRQSKNYVALYCETLQKATEHYDESERKRLLELLQYYDAPAVLIETLTIPPTRQNSPVF